MAYNAWRYIALLTQLWSDVLWVRANEHIVPCSIPRKFPVFLRPYFYFVCVVNGLSMSMRPPSNPYSQSPIVLGVCQQQEADGKQLVLLLLCCGCLPSSVWLFLKLNPRPLAEDAFLTLCHIWIAPGSACEESRQGEESQWKNGSTV